MRLVSNYINGTFKSSVSSEFTEVINPYSEEILARTPHSKKEEVDEAIKLANKAFEGWSKTPVIDRVQPLFKLKALLEENAKEICEILTREHGKTYKEFLKDRFLTNRAYLLKEVESIPLPWKALPVEAGYFVIMDISACTDYIPKKYLESTEFEDDDDQKKIKKYEFRMADGKIPLDLAFCRWMAHKNGVVMIPLSFFYA